MNWLWSLKNSGEKIVKLSEITHRVAIVLSVLLTIIAEIVFVFKWFFDIPYYIRYSENILGYCFNGILMMLMILISGFLIAFSSWIYNLFLHAFGTIAENSEAMLYLQLEKDEKSKTE